MVRIPGLQYRHREIETTCQVENCNEPIVIKKVTKLRFCKTHRKLRDLEVNGVSVFCQNCGKKYKVTGKHYRRRESKRFYCEDCHSSIPYSHGWSHSFKI